MFLQRQRPILSIVVLACFAFSYPASSQGPQTRPAPGNNQGGRPPGGGNPGGGNRPNPGGGNPGGGNPGGGNRPNPGNGNPGGGNPGGPPPRPNPGNGGNRPNPGNGGGNRPGPNPGNGGNRPSPGGPGGNRPGPGTRPPGGGRPPQWGRPPQNRPSYNFRPNDRSYLRRYYLRNLGYINRLNRPRFIIGGFFPYAYIGYITPLPPQLYGYLPPPPPGYAMGYYDGYVVVYDPVTYFIANVVDLIDN